MNTVRTVGIDLAKNVFQIHAIDASGKVVLKKKLRRDSLMPFMANLPKCLVGMEACGGAHYWAREFRKMGHDVKLMSPQFVKPYVKTNKNDMADAEAIAEAVTRPNMRFVPIKKEGQQDVLIVHRTRERLVRNRTALMNEIRGFLQERGMVFPRGAACFKSNLLKILSGDDTSAAFSKILQDLYSELIAIEEQVSKYDEAIKKMYTDSDENKRLGEIPGIGPITATAMTSTVGNANYFKNGRQLSAWLGLVPRQHSSGGKSILGRISKRGDNYVRKLLVHGARTVLRHAANKTDERSNEWKRKIERIGFNKACVALANKNARRCWALMANGTRYRA